MASFDLDRPHTLVDALAGVSAGGVPYCGGTELFAVMKLGLMAPAALVDLKHVPELNGIDADGSEIVIGARATHAEVAGSSLVNDAAPVLAEACARLGNARVRATGTLAGNVCFAEPRSDVMTALVALGGRIDLVGADQRRRSVPMEQFVEGAFTTVRQDDELVEAIRLPRRQGRGTYIRFQPSEYPTVSVALVRNVDDSGVRVAVGAVGDRPELVVADDLDSVDAGVIAESVDVTEDLNGSPEYKRHLTSVMVRRAIDRLRDLEGHA